LTTIYWPTCEYYNGCKKNQQLLRDLYAGITMVVKKSTSITRPICKYCNVCKKPAIITRPICMYYIFEMALWKL
jgi:hypothetical protein